MIQIAPTNSNDIAIFSHSIIVLFMAFPTHIQAHTRTQTHKSDSDKVRIHNYNIIATNVDN